MEKQKRSGDRKRLFAAGIIALLVVSTFLLWGIATYKKGQLIQGAGISLVALTILVFALMVLKRQYSSIKKGFPYEDERSKKIMTRALANAYLLSLYWLLALGWASDGWIQFRDVSQAMSAGILGMAVLFGLSYVYVGWRGVE